MQMRLSNAIFAVKIERFERLIFHNIIQREQHEKWISSQRIAIHRCVLFRQRTTIVERSDIEHIPHHSGGHCYSLSSLALCPSVLCRHCQTSAISCPSETSLGCSTIDVASNYRSTGQLNWTIPRLPAAEESEEKNRRSMVARREGQSWQ